MTLLSGQPHDIRVYSTMIKFSKANIQSIKKALLKKDLIDINGQEITINDSLFKLWLKRQRYYE